MTKNQTTITLFIVGIVASVIISVFLPAAASSIISATFALTFLHFVFGD